MEYNIRVYKPELKQEEGKINNLKGFATITFDEAFCVKSLAIKESSKGNLYLDMPRYRDYETGEYVPFFRFTDKEFQKEVLDTVREAYENMTETKTDCKGSWGEEELYYNLSVNPVQGSDTFKADVAIRLQDVLAIQQLHVIQAWNGKTFVGMPQKNSASITQTAKNDFSYKNAFTVIKKYVDIKKIFPNINITSDMKKINKYVNKSIIENAFVNYEGYVGILNCLPTYFENINEISFDVALDRYLKLYFHQDIQFYKTRLGTVEHINNLKAIRNEIFKYGFYNITVLEIKKNWKLWYGKTNIYLIDSITSNKIKLNRVAAVLIESIDGRRSIKEIVEIIGLSYQDKSRINFECISTILQLIKEGVLYPLKIRVVTE